MKILLERHTYAPELNKAHILRHGRIVAVLPCPQCDSIAAARAQLFPRYKPAIICHIEKRNDAAPVLNKDYDGIVYALPELLRFLRREKEKSPAFTALDGRSIPASQFSARIKTQYIRG
jgi:hypothetical protein